MSACEAEVCMYCVLLLGRVRMKIVGAARCPRSYGKAEGSVIIRQTARDLCWQVRGGETRHAGRNVAIRHEPIVLRLFPIATIVHDTSSNAA